MSETTDPKKWLTKFLTQLIPKDQDKDGKQGPSLLDLNTEFPNSEAVRLQLFYRNLGEDFGLPFFSSQADKIAKIMWSFQRKSRAEATTSLIEQEEEEQSIIRSKMYGEDEEEKEEK